MYASTKLSQNEFPTLLTQIPDLPKQLYIRGVLPQETYFLCVVGPRNFSDYGKEVCEHLLHQLTGYPITIVSGLARGIDSIAHRSALDASLPTVAVLASGLDMQSIYPRAHRQLAKTIVDTGGALLSEFADNFGATNWSFPRRNRIMAGMSHAVLVIEAAEKSGSLITAELGLDYNRDVMTVPGSIFDTQRKGNHALLTQGATPVTSADDILNILGITKNETSKKINSSAISTLSEEEHHIVSLLQKTNSRDELMRIARLPTQKTSEIISVLEIKGVLHDVGGNVYLRNSLKNLNN